MALAEFLAESRQIEQLDLRQNEVKVGGLMALCLALRINHSLANLHLDHSAPQEQVGPDIIDHLHVLHCNVFQLVFSHVGVDRAATYVASSVILQLANKKTTIIIRT